MKKRKLGRMHWFFALLLWFLAHLVAYILLTSVLPHALIRVPISTALHALVVANFLLLRARDCVWYMLTFRRYCTSMPYFIINILHIVWIGVSTFGDAIDTPLARSAYFIYVAVNLAISILTFVFFINRPGKETALEETASEPSDA